MPGELDSALFLFGSKRMWLFPDTEEQAQESRREGNYLDFPKVWRFNPMISRKSCHCSDSHAVALCGCDQAQGGEGSRVLPQEGRAWRTHRLRRHGQVLHAMAGMRCPQLLR